MSFREKFRETINILVNEKKARVRQLHEADYSCKEIASIMDLPESTVREWVNH